LRDDIAQMFFVRLRIAEDFKSYLDVSRHVHASSSVSNRSKREKKKLRGRDLVVRLIGVPTPVGGIDWDPPSEERDRARQVLAHLAEQPVLCDPYDMAIGSFVTQSILGTRERLGGELEGLAGDSVLTEGLRARQAACRMFLEENESPRSGCRPRD